MSAYRKSPTPTTGKTPVSLLGARQAVGLAKYAGASQDAPDELRIAEDHLQAAEQAWRLNQPIAEIDIKARLATRSALTPKNWRPRGKPLVCGAMRSGAAMRLFAPPNALPTRCSRVAQLRSALEEQRARELAERDAGSANDQLREKRVEIARLRDEIQTMR